MPRSNTATFNSNLTTYYEDGPNVPNGEDKEKVVNIVEPSVLIPFRRDVNYQTRSKHYWLEDKASITFIFKIATGFYALFVVILGVVIDLSSLIAGGNKPAASGRDLFLAVFMYGGSLAFLGYFCVSVVKRVTEVRTERRQSILLTGKFNYQMSATQTSVSTGSLYLRMGCVAFGMIGVVYYMLMFLVCNLGWVGKEKDCNYFTQIIALLASAFILAQMWFVFCNGKVAIRGHENVARFGLMHLFATNLRMWVCYILYEEAQTVHELQHARFEDEFPGHGDHGHHDLHNITAAHAMTEPCLGAHCVFGEANELMYTCVVEYSLICAGVAFVFWTSVGNKSQVEGHAKNRSIITMDCSRSYVGLFSGFGFLMVTIIAVVLFNAYAHEKELSQWIFLLTHVLIFAIAIGVCVYGFWRMRFLEFKEKDPDEEAEEASAEFLDQILLVVGLMGELAYCACGILAFINNDEREGLSFLLATTHLFRLVQVIIQSALIFISNRLILNIDDPHVLKFKPGKQVITLLVAINASLFLLNVFEASKAGITEEIVRLYGHRSWALVVRGTSPLTIFYRFHASACFAEIWKKTYKVPYSHRPTSPFHR